MCSWNDQLQLIWYSVWTLLSNHTEAWYDTGAPLIWGKCFQVPFFLEGWILLFISLMFFQPFYHCQSIESWKVPTPSLQAGWEWPINNQHRPKETCYFRPHNHFHQKTCCPSQWFEHSNDKGKPALRYLQTGTKDGKDRIHQANTKTQAGISRLLPACHHSQNDNLAAQTHHFSWNTLVD